MLVARPILIIEDDTGFRQVLTEQLAEAGGFQAVEAATLAEATRLLEADDVRFDAIILDINLPDGDGRNFCVQLRRKGYQMPIIILTGACSDEDVVCGLEAGANDYIIKPFRVNELIARIKAQLRLFDNSVYAVFKIGSYTFCPSAKLLLDPKNQRIRLTGKEVAILKFLYRTGDRAVSRQKLLEGVWGYNSALTTHTLETHIYRLRQKIEDDPRDCRLLMTAPGGYRLAMAGDAAVTPGVGPSPVGFY
ncbi:MAG: response regulator transcription factor [Rhodopila sp.]|jgi:DNA-binding response OmpR family regulator